MYNDLRMTWYLKNDYDNSMELWKFCYFLLSMFISQEIRFSLVSRYFRHLKMALKASMIGETTVHVKFFVYFIFYGIVRYEKHVMYCIVYFVFYVSLK